MSILSALARSIDAANSQDELSDFINNHLSLDRGLTIQFAGEEGSRQPDFSYGDISEIKLAPDRVSIRFGTATRSTELVIEKENAYFNLPDGQSLAISDAIRLIAMSLREQDTPQSTGGGGGTTGPISISDVQGLTTALTNKQASSSNLTGLSQVNTTGLLYKSGNVFGTTSIDSFQPASTRLSGLDALANPSTAQVMFLLSSGAIGLGNPLDPNSFQPRSDRLSELNGLTAQNGRAIGFNSSGNLTSLNIISDTSSFQAASTRLTSLVNLTAQTAAQVLFLMPNGSISYGAPLDPATFQPVNTRLTQLTALTATSGRAIGFDSNGALTPLNVLSDASAFQSASARLTQLTGLTAVAGNAIGFNASGALTSLSFLSDATAFQPASTRLSSLTALTAQTTAQVLFLMPNGSIAYGAPLDPATFQPVNTRLTQLSALTAQAGRVIGYNASGALTNIEVLSTTDAQTLARSSISGTTPIGYSSVTGEITYTGTVYNPASVAITGGSINGTAIGGTTRSTGSFVTLGIQNTAATQTPLIIQTVSGQSADNITVNDSAGSPAFRVTASGTINLKSGTTIRMGNDPNPANNPTILGARNTGWSTTVSTPLPTGMSATVVADNKTLLGTVTAPGTYTAATFTGILNAQNARINALINAFLGHGAIGA